jgi:cytochrome c
LGLADHADANGAAICTGATSLTGRRFLVTSSRFALAAIMFAATAIGPQALAQDMPAGDPVSGQKVFEQYCHICHYTVPGKQYIGPSLYGVFGRHIGREPSYHYSKTDLNADLVFDATTLDRYITSPQGAVHGSTMAYVGIKSPKLRADLIAYLATLH